MQTTTLHGNWTLILEDGQEITGQLPGCNYLDLMRHSLLENPFWGQNEQKAKEIAHQDFIYARTFLIPQSLIAEKNVELVVHGVDTLAVFYINNIEAARTDNIHRTWRISVKDYLQVGENHIRILFRSPYPLLQQKHSKRPLPAMGMGEKGVSYLRKVQCHFGWDWGPQLPPVGIIGGITLEGYSHGRIKQASVVQEHLEDGSVRICIRTDIQSGTAASERLALQYRVEGPSGEVYETAAPVMDWASNTKILIDQPQLWWCSGLGGQPLYTVKAELVYATGNRSVLDVWQRRIGFRTIELDTADDQWGSNFRFRINGIPIFAKGANWIPSDSFVTRTTKEDLAFYIESARHANMNMLRVWGGGHYESDDFYNLCDENGILVWQDFAFACKVYPFDDAVFLDNLHREAEDNVRRLRHHACLALWCGNNEILMMSPMWRKDDTMTNMINSFFFDTLPSWVKENDLQTPYWPGSPSSGAATIRANNFESGDTHLWQVWHGLSPMEAFRKFPTRFCSEYGLESLPSIQVIHSFTDNKEPCLSDEDMLAHQKSGGGNDKMLYYLLAKYKRPAAIKDTIYLTQLAQAEVVRSATEFWRQNMGRCNGSLYWQYNDCWPVSSWAGIDYGKQYKALQYQARHFNKPVCVSAQILGRKAQVYIINEIPRPLEGTLIWCFSTFDGKELSAGTRDIQVEQSMAKRMEDLPFSKHLRGASKRDCVLSLTLIQNEETISQRNYLLVPDKKVRLQNPNIQMELMAENNAVCLRLRANHYARSVFIKVEGLEQPLSDNFFDISVGEIKTVYLPIAEDMILESIKQRIQVHSLYDIETDSNWLKDIWTRISMRLKKKSILAWFMTRV